MTVLICFSLRSLLRIAQGPLHIAYTFCGAVPAEMGVPKAVCQWLQPLYVRQKEVAARCLGQIWHKQHAFLRKQALQGQSCMLDRSKALARELVFQLKSVCT